MDYSQQIFFQWKYSEQTSLVAELDYNISVLVDIAVVQKLAYLEQKQKSKYHHFGQLLRTDWLAKSRQALLAPLDCWQKQ
ncbi:hypothetical protein ACVRZR_08670 [Streptococcus entericus]|uniref:hypothetical protein n=1 Tax=Streptococcus entericus TaxID=155680 RepID=UPI000374CA3F|nr:hypothetical protein [Streptococcus entericus]